MKREPASSTDDRYARESFTFRRMRPWQIWTAAIAAVAVLVAAIAFA